MTISCYSCWWMGSERFSCSSLTYEINTKIYGFVFPCRMASQRIVGSSPSWTQVCGKPYSGLWWTLHFCHLLKWWHSENLERPKNGRKNHYNQVALKLVGFGGCYSRVQSKVEWGAKYESLVLEISVMKYTGVPCTWSYKILGCCFN